MPSWSGTLPRAQHSVSASAKPERWGRVPLPIASPFAVGAASEIQVSATGNARATMLVRMLPLGARGVKRTGNLPPGQTERHRDATSSCIKTERRRELWARTVGG